MSEQQPRDSRGHFLRHGAIPYALEPDAWDDTCRHEPQAATRARSGTDDTTERESETQQ